MSIELMMPSNHLVLCCPLLLLPSIFSSIRGFANEFALCIRWPKYQTFSFSISPSNEYSGLISFRMGWFDLFAVHVTLRGLLQHHTLLWLLTKGDWAWEEGWLMTAALRSLQWGPCILLGAHQGPCLPSCSSEFSAGEAWDSGSPAHPRGPWWTGPDGDVYGQNGTRHHLGGHEISYGSAFSLHVQHSAGYRGLWMLPDTSNLLPTWTVSLELGRMVQAEVKVLVTQSCPTLCGPTDCSLPGSSVHGIFWAKILKWVASPSSRGSSWPRDQNWVSWIAGRFFTVWTTRVLRGFKTLFLMSNTSGKSST